VQTFEMSGLARDGCMALTPSITSGRRWMQLSSRPLHPSSRPPVCGMPIDLAAHPARPSRRRASSCVTYEVCPAASRARQSASAALSSASSSSCALAACSRARKRRKSDTTTTTTTAAWPPRWITSYDPCPGRSPGSGRLAGRSSCCLLYGASGLCCLSWHACGPARCHAAATAPGCCLIPLDRVNCAINPV